MPRSRRPARRCSAGASSSPSSINFLILAFIIFLLVRWATRLMRKQEAAPAGPSEVELLTEIRDELRKRA